VDLISTRVSAGSSASRRCIAALLSRGSFDESLVMFTTLHRARYSLRDAIMSESPGYGISVVNSMARG